MFLKCKRFNQYALIIYKRKQTLSIDCISTLQSFKSYSTLYFKRELILLIENADLHDGSLLLVNLYQKRCASSYFSFYKKEVVGI